MSVSRNSAKLSVNRVRQPKQYSLAFTAEGEQGRHVPDMTRQRIPGSYTIVQEMRFHCEFPWVPWDSDSDY